MAAVEPIDDLGRLSSTATGNARSICSTRAPASADPAEHLELRAQAAYGNGEFEASVSAWEDLHALLVGQGDDGGRGPRRVHGRLFLMIDSGLDGAGPGLAAACRPVARGDARRPGRTR